MTTYPTSDEICNNATLFETVYWLGIVNFTLIFFGNLAIVAKIVLRNYKRKEFKDIEIMKIAFTTMIFSSSLIMCSQAIRNMHGYRAFAQETHNCTMEGMIFLKFAGIFFLVAYFTWNYISVILTFTYIKSYFKLRYFVQKKPYKPQVVTCIQWMFILLNFAIMVVVVVAGFTLLSVMQDKSDYTRWSQM